MKLDYEKMWNKAKEEFAKYMDSEAYGILNQIEEEEANKKDTIDELIKEVSK